jgi:hypothetical protein
MISAAFTDAYETLSPDLAWLHVRWQLYQQLFCKGERRIALLNETAGFFFYVTQQILLSDVILGVCRLSDPPSMGKRHNLVLKSLVKLVESASHPKLAIELQVILQEFKEAVQPLKTHRNRRIAHRDSDAALRASSKPLPNISLHQIERPLEIGQRFLKAIERTFKDAETHYSDVILHDDANALVATLVQGIDYEAALGEGIIPLSREVASKYRGA